MARKLAIDGQAVAYAVLEALLAESAIEPCWDNQDINGVADHVITAADVEYLPRARRLTLSFDLSGEPSTSGEAQDLDEPVPFVPVPVDAPPAD